MNRFEIVDGQGKGIIFECDNLVKARSMARKQGYKFCVLEEIREVTPQEKAYYECKTYMDMIHNENKNPHDKLLGNGQTDFLKLIVTGDSGDDFNHKTEKPSEDTIELARQYARELGPSVYYNFNLFF